MDDARHSKLNIARVRLGYRPAKRARRNILWVRQRIHNQSLAIVAASGVLAKAECAGESQRFVIRQNSWANQPNYQRKKSGKDRNQADCGAI